MRIIGQILCRNEADVIVESVDAVMQWVDALVVLDGASDDGTLELLRSLTENWARLKKTILVRSRPDTSEVFHDHYRNELLELSAPLEPDWILSVDADEIYDSYSDHKGNIVDPYTAIMNAEAAGANVVRSYVPQFWLTLDDLRHPEREVIFWGSLRSVQHRLSWYSWGHMGTFIWKWDPRHFYPPKTAKRTPEIPGQNWRQWQRAGPLYPVCKHYCYRSLEQAIKRTRERRDRAGGRQYFGKYHQPLAFPIDEVAAGLHYLGQDGVWNAENNHDRVCRYMAGELT